MRVLISTIIRNRAKHVSPWANQLQSLANVHQDTVFDLVVLENDSNDGTKQALSAVEPLLKRNLNKVNIAIRNFEWPYFHSIKAEERVKYLALARNKTLLMADEIVGLEAYDKIISIEPDVTYSTVDVGTIIDSDLDIASGYSVLPQGMGVPDWIYDSWATRVNAEDSEYFGPKISELPECLPLAATFNCFCVYKAGPIADGARFSEINPKTKQWDCDTTTICIEFAKRGYDRIGMYKIPVLHKP
jgi:hypothetical protein